MSIQAIIEEVQEVRKAVEAASPGDPRLPGLKARIAQVGDDLARAKSVLGPLVPNAANPATLEEQTAASLERSLATLAAIVEAKSVVGS